MSKRINTIELEGKLKMNNEEINIDGEYIIRNWGIRGEVEDIRYATQDSRAPTVAVFEADLERKDSDVKLNIETIDNKFIKSIIREMTEEK